MFINRRHFFSFLGSYLFLTPSVLKPREDKLSVVTTTSMICDAVNFIGGDFVIAKSLMGPGVDPHSYRPTRTDIVSMAKATLTFYHGLDLEIQMKTFFEKLEKKKKVIAVAETIEPNFLLPYPGHRDRYDPHVWMDPVIWSKVILPITRTFAQLMPQNQKYFQRNAQEYIKEISELDKYAKKTMDSIPQNARYLLTAHDAFGYFGRAYDMEVIGVQGISTNSEAGLNRMHKLVDFIVQRKISAVFIETSLSDRNIRALIEGAAARKHQLQLGGELYSDAMGPQGTYEATYLGMMDHNVTKIATALGGKAPKRGWKSKLKDL